jgi:hypothetical protein
MKPVVVVDPYSSGAELAPAFAERGVPAIAVLSSADPWAGYPTPVHLRQEDFLAVHVDHPGLAALLRRLDPIAVVAGAETGVLIADRLAAELTPHRANDPALSAARRHKGLQQQAIAAAGLPAIRTLYTGSADETARWLADQGLSRAALIIKPVDSMGSDNVRCIPPGGDWRRDFDEVLAGPTMFGGVNDAVIVQEFVTGTEYSVDTVSADRHHVLANIIKATKVGTVFDRVEFIAFDEGEHGALVAYTRDVLDALGIRWGAAHSDVMLTDQGPRLVETGARTCGGPSATFARVATGSSQIERVVQAYTDGVISTPDFEHEQLVMPVFLAAARDGVLRNVEVLDQLRSLSTHLRSYVWAGNGDRVVRTTGYASNLGIIALTGDRDALLADYARVRAVESLLRIVE